MTTQQRQRRLALIRRRAGALPPGPRHFDPDLVPLARGELEIEIAEWKKAATNAGFSQRSPRYAALGPRGRW